MSENTPDTDDLRERIAERLRKYGSVRHDRHEDAGALLPVVLAFAAEQSERAAREALLTAHTEIARRFDVVDAEVKRTYWHAWRMTRDLAEHVLGEALGNTPEVPDSAESIERRAKVAILRDFAQWAGEMPEDTPGGFEHNLLVSAARAMADLLEQGRSRDGSLPAAPAPQQDGSATA